MMKDKKDIKLRPIVQLELSKFNQIPISKRRLAYSEKHKNVQYACFPFYKRISKYGKSNT